MKKVIKIDHKDIIPCSEVSKNRIYILFSDKEATLYKAHRISSEQWAFIALDDSECYANGIHSSLKEMCERTLNRFNDVTILEFSSLKGFIDWAVLFCKKQGD